MISAEKENELLKQIKAGNNEARIELSDLYFDEGMFHRRTEEEKIDKAKYYFEHACELEHMGALILMANYYATGLPLLEVNLVDPNSKPIDPQRATEYYKRIIAKNESYGKLKLGVIYLLGLFNNEVDESEAERLISEWKQAFNIDSPDKQKDEYDQLLIYKGINELRYAYYQKYRTFNNPRSNDVANLNPESFPFLRTAIDYMQKLVNWGLPAFKVMHGVLSEPELTETSEHMLSLSRQILAAMTGELGNAEKASAELNEIGILDDKPVFVIKNLESVHIESRAVDTVEIEKLKSEYQKVTTSNSSQNLTKEYCKKQVLVLNALSKRFSEYANEECVILWANCRELIKFYTDEYRKIENEIILREKSRKRLKIGVAVLAIIVVVVLLIIIAVPKLLSTFSPVHKEEYVREIPTVGNPKISTAAEREVDTTAIDEITSPEPYEQYESYTYETSKATTVITREITTTEPYEATTVATYSSFNVAREVESNGVYYKSANEILLDTLYTANLSGAYDIEKDWFAFTVTNAGTYSVQLFTPQLNDSKRYWDFYVCTEQQAYNFSRDFDVRPENTSGTLTEYELFHRYVPGNITSTYSEFYLTPGRYYIRMESSVKWSAADYEFIVKHV